MSVLTCVAVARPRCHQQEEVKPPCQRGTSEEEIETHMTTAFRPDTIACITSGTWNDIEVDRGWHRRWLGGWSVNRYVGGLQVAIEML